MLAYCSFNMCSGVISDVLSVWFKMCLSFLSGWFLGCFRVGSVVYCWLAKSVQGLIRNLSNIHALSFGFGFGFVLGRG